ncbi:MAG: hypothetical protein JXQ73_06940 [Phycisphaerae bacterium]|nr:hypothetical protein [Phycisphaerae bacterium]
MKQPVLNALVLLAALSICGACLPAPTVEAPGGLEASDFVQVSLNGFDPADHQLDRNDYAWSMTWFQPDGEPRGYLYVGTGNDLISQFYRKVDDVLGLDGEGGGVKRWPEIRRYRHDSCATCWERVFDCRDAEDGPLCRTLGFRCLCAYRASSDGVLYLYAGTLGREAEVWRSSTGNPATWQRVWTSGQVGSIRDMKAHGNVLYLAVANEIPGTPHVGAIWATDGEHFWPVVSDGFGNPDNTAVMALASFNGWLCAGTSNQATGCEVWKLLGPDGRDDPVRVIAAGGPDPANQSAITFCAFQGELYVGTLVSPFLNAAAFEKGADLLRIDAADRWETVVGTGSSSGVRSGFGHRPNAYLWSMAVHDGWLYAGTFDHVSAMTHGLMNLDQIIKSYLTSRKGWTTFELLLDAGADLYKTPNGADWYPVTLAGLGDPGNYGIRTMQSVGDSLYFGTANPFDGLEVWRAISR